MGPDCTIVVCGRRPPHVVMLAAARVARTVHHLEYGPGLEGDLEEGLMGARLAVLDLRPRGDGSPLRLCSSLWSRGVSTLGLLKPCQITHLELLRNPDDFAVAPFRTEEIQARISRLLGISDRSVGLIDFDIRYESAGGIPRTAVEAHAHEVPASQDPGVRPDVFALTVVEVSLMRLRRKLADAGKRNVETVRGYGYRLPREQHLDCQPTETLMTAVRQIRSQH